MVWGRTFRCNAPQNATLNKKVIGQGLPQSLRVVDGLPAGLVGWGRDPISVLFLDGCPCMGILEILGSLQGLLGFFYV